MDTADPDIIFDENSFCNHCTDALKKLKSYPLNLNSKEKERELQKIVERIKESGKNKDYDCIVGVSGGVDSSYVLYLVKNLGLRPLAVHLDNGWNTELSDNNRKKILEKLDIKLHTVTVDWAEFKDLQLSFLKSSTPDLEIPTDHAINAVLNDIALKYKIKYIISGANTITESIGVSKWSYGHHDWRYIKLIQKKFGLKKLKTYAHSTYFKMFYRQVVQKINMIPIINYIPEYNKKKVISLLEKEFGWTNYPTKHGESIYTFFIQSYILPVKFNYDKRKMHLSNLICAGQITRKEALALLKKPLFTESELKEMKKYVCNKLDITIDEFESFMKLPKKSFYDYPSYETDLTYKILRFMYKKVKSIRS
jgi:N-acetyl sugar amidotransferase